MTSCFYVAPNGEDTADGLTPATAWQTLKRASAHPFQAGDHLLLQADASFEGPFTLGEGGAITIGAFGEGRAKILAGEGEAIRVVNRKVTIENIEAIGGWNSDTQSGSSAFGIVVGCHLPGDAKLPSVVISNVVAHGFRNAGIAVEGGGPDGSRSGFDGVLIENCEAYHNGAAGIAMHGQWENKRPGWCHVNVKIKGCIAHHNRGLRDLKSHSGSGIVISDLQHGVIEHSLAYENGELNDFVGGGPVGIWCWDCDSVTIRHCESHSNRTMTKDGGGFDLDGGCTNCVLEHNYSHDNAGCGVLICQYNTARPFHHNTVRFHRSVNDGRHNGGGVIVYDDYDGISDIAIHGNHFTTGPGHTGHEVPAPLRLLTPSARLNITNNIFECTGNIPIAEVVDGQAEMILRDNRFINRDGATLVWHGETISDEAQILDRLGPSNCVED